MKFLQLFIFVLCSISFFESQARTEECVKVDVQFEGLPQPHFYKHRLNFTNKLQLNPYHSKSLIVNTTSEVRGRFPQTIVLLVKPTYFSDDAITLQFNLVHYGFSRAGSILTQPVIVVKKGQFAELNTDKFKLKVHANWG